MDRKFKKTMLANGTQVVSEYHSQSRSVSLGIWVDRGTRHEPNNQVGISHLLEHMVFKGTKSRTAYQIAKSLEALGGDLNAFTSRENTCYHALVLKDHADQAFEVLADLVTNMKFSKKDFSLEKNVILQEIAMSEESPEEFIYDLFFEACFDGNPLGRSILGSMQTVKSLTMQQIYSHYKSHYQGSNLLVSAAGNVDHEELVAQASIFLNLKKSKPAKVLEKKPRWKTARKIKEKDTEQMHVLVGLPFPSILSKERFVGVILNTALGGGMTSRLYQSVRERRGLAYTIYSTLNSFKDSGVLNIYAGVDSDKLEELVDIISHELNRFKKQGLRKGEIESYKTQVIGNILLGADDPENRMNSIAINETLFGEYRTPEQVVEMIQKMTVSDVNDCIEQWIKPEKMAGCLMGPDLSRRESWWKDFQF